MSKSAKKSHSGYSLYAKEARPRVAEGIKASKGEKPNTVNVKKEVDRRWDKLPEGTRDIWNKKAKK